MSFVKSADHPSGNMVMLDPGRLEKLEEAPGYPRFTGMDASRCKCHLYPVGMLF